MKSQSILWHFVSKCRINFSKRNLRNQNRFCPYSKKNRTNRCWNHKDENLWNYSETLEIQKVRPFDETEILDDWTKRSTFQTEWFKAETKETDWAKGQSLSQTETETNIWKLIDQMKRNWNETFETQNMNRPNTSFQTQNTWQTDAYKANQTQTDLSSPTRCEASHLKPLSNWLRLNRILDEYFWNCCYQIEYTWMILNYSTNYTITSETINSTKHAYHGRFWTDTKY